MNNRSARGRRPSGQSAQQLRIEIRTYGLGGRRHQKRLRPRAKKPPAGPSAEETPRGTDGVDYHGDRHGHKTRTTAG